MKPYISLYIFVILFLFNLCHVSAQIKFNKLVWSDEFEYNGPPDQDKWVFDRGDGCPNLCGWGNNELQYYTDREDNARVENGQLVVEARKENLHARQYTSAKLRTKGTGDWKYGRVEVSAKLPSGTGTWPAIWMLPTLKRKMQWPKDGEIDIMEHVGYNQGWIFGTIHTKKYNHIIGTHKSDSIYIQDAYLKFHTYAMEWDRNEMTWFVDGEPYFTINRGNDGQDGWPFDEKFHLILNVAVGGNWGGKYGVDDKIWPQRMVVEYVRVYQ